MITNKRIGFIGGGAMAQALIRGVLNAKLLTPGQIWVCDIAAERRAQLQESFPITALGADTSESREMVKKSDILVLAVKPHVIPAVLDSIAPLVQPAATVVSIAAGITIASIEEKLPQNPVARVMPNTPAAVGAGMSAVALGKYADETVLENLLKIFSSVGQAIAVAESALDAVTALSGSGPGYAFLIIEALMGAGIKEGLTRQDATVLAAQTLLGAAQMVVQTGEHPAKLKDMVTSPGGTTIAGLYVLEKRGVRAALMEAVAAAAARAREMGKKE